MMKVEEKKYYGNEKLQNLSYLEFGSIDLEKGKKEIWGYCQHQQAYDYYMFARYANDLFLFRDFINKEKEQTVEKFNEYVVKSAHNKLMDYIFKYAGLVSILDDNNWQKSFCESGSSLYGLIDECIALDHIYNDGKHISKINSIKYVGSDISMMMHKGAQAFHPENEFLCSTAYTINELLDEVKSIDLFYGLSVSLRYALREAIDLIKIGKRCGLSIFNRISLSYGETLCSSYGTGKSVYIISLPEYIELLHKNNILAKYCTANMQHNKDGENTVRVSIAMAKSSEQLDKFIGHYEKYIDASQQVEGIQKGLWKDIDYLMKKD